MGAFAARAIFKILLGPFDRYTIIATGIAGVVGIVVLIGWFQRPPLRGK